MQDIGQPLLKFLPLDRAPALQPDRLPFLKEKRLELTQPQGAPKLRVISELRMRIQRQMRTVNRDIVFQQQLHELVALLGPGMTGSPEQSVVHDQQVRTELHRLANRGGA